jgi:hypothetical protein
MAQMPAGCMTRCQKHGACPFNVRSMTCGLLVWWRACEIAGIADRPQVPVPSDPGAGVIPVDARRFPRAPRCGYSRRPGLFGRNAGSQGFQVTRDGHGVAVVDDLRLSGQPPPGRNCLATVELRARMPGGELKGHPHAGGAEGDGSRRLGAWTGVSNSGPRTPGTGLANLVPIPSASPDDTHPVRRRISSPAPSPPSGGSGGSHIAHPTQCAQRR